MNSINVVLVEPEIHQNTGNIARTCAVTGASLHLVKPLGFSTDDRLLKRAGLDYWDKLDITYYENLNDFLEKNKNEKMVFFSAHGSKNYADYPYPAGDKRVFLVFGKESCGLPKELIEKNADDCVRIPMRKTLRCLNLSNSVAIAVYEVLRQRDFEGLSMSDGADGDEYWENGDA